jgi:hypothetical protein
MTPRSGARASGSLTRRASTRSGSTSRIHRRDGGATQATTDLVLICCWLSGQIYSSNITIDWQSALSGELTDREAGITTLTLGAIVERITRDLERGIEDGAYGVGQVVNDPALPTSPMTRELIVNTLAGIAAALGARGLGV